MTKQAKIKIAEMFYSLQGEGYHTGVPSVFVRTFGCNFTCSGFGMPKGLKSVEHEQVDPSLYTKYDDLPLVHTGCDSYASWDVRFKHLSPVLSVSAIAQHIVSLIPSNNWTNTHLIITGGEPLLGWQRSYPELLSQPELGTLTDLTFETNGTQVIQQQLVQYFNTNSHIRVTFSVSAKLPQSGHTWEEAICPQVVKQYQDITNSLVCFKFVVGEYSDFDDVDRAVHQYKDAGLKPFLVYVMPVGGTSVHYDSNVTWVANEALRRGYRYSPRLQVSLWKNAWGT